MPYMGVTSLAAKQVCLGLVKHATCTDFLPQIKNYSLLSATNLCNLQQLDLLQDRFECGRYINTSLFDLFCTNVSKQDAHFCCRFYHPLVSCLVPENILTSQ